jgi:Rps23 Pro-64 3,4-dihydroxylase Tpa1-like proline 4-hydroxylase
MRQLLLELNSYPFICFLEKLTGINGLVADPEMQGGGVHQTMNGGFLKIHADFNWHAKLQLDRRINVLFYLNKNWQDSYGGHLELWDRNMTNCQRKVSPIFNRLAIFNTTDYSFHGHPDPLSCPPELARTSVAMYYYTNGRPITDRRYGKRKTTLYEERPGENFHSKSVKAHLKRMIPRWFWNRWYR